MLFLVPNLTEKDMTTLRNGGRIVEPKKAFLSFTYKIKNDKGVWETARGNLKAEARDIAQINAFFGDRPLDNPGYSEFKLKGAVGVNQTNDVLDVYRVEQRLKYLGFPAIGTGAGNTLKNFDVNGSFTDKEKAALKLFEKVVRYQNSGSNAKFNNDLNGADGIILADAQGKVTTNWLNAYNAPHWMQFFASTPNSKTGSDQFATLNPKLSGWENQQFGTTDRNVELYGTSWLYDLMAAKQFAPSALVQSGSWFNGSVDANYGVTPKWVKNGIHSSHDLGLAFDLGVSNYISSTVQGRKNDPLLSAINNLPSVSWSVANALAYTQPTLASGALGLPDKKLPPKDKNDQVSALRDFLSLYAVTRSDTIEGNGTWDDLPVKNGEAARAALFGSGKDAGGLISKVLIGDAGYTNKAGTWIPLNNNPYRSINAILDKLGINDANPADSHHNHFHIYLAPPKPKPIDLPKNLSAHGLSDAAADQAVPETAEAQAMLGQISSLLNPGEELMFIMDVPYVPAPQTPIVLAGGTSSTTNTTGQPGYILKECQEVPSVGDPRSAQRVVDPAGMLRNYMESRVNRALDLAAFKNPTLLEGPKHGKMTRGVDNEGFVAFGFDPTPEYIGKDRAVFTVEYKGQIYKIVADFIVSRRVDENTPLCPADPKLIKVKQPSSGSSGFDLNGVSVSFADLPNGALGQTTGTTITLDDNAAGHGWFIDFTPSLNEEFLPTADPTVWKAKPGSEAEGKMDMLSVLLHEYGHALGLDHSADSHDYMAATLQPSERRTLSADDQLALMQLTGYFPTPDSPSDPFSPFLGTPLLFGLGRLRGSLGTVTPTLSPGERGLNVHYQVAPNATLTNPVFAGNTGWSTTGSVTFANGTAVLTESAAAQTRLNQLFVLNDNDRFLRFTLDDIALDDVNNAPDDAFEVALIDANSGLSLLGGTGLTRSDALLNLQADGTEHLASAVTRTLNADGSRTYLVDLTGIASGTVASLSFDLIGFGRAAAATSSHLTVRDLSIGLGVPQTHDDTATTAEDTPVNIAVLANDLDVGQSGFVPVVVADLAHGQVVLNADGSFGYTPDQDWYGDDSFSYKLSSNGVDSNVAIVLITVTPVNDAPVASANTPLAAQEDAATAKIGLDTIY